MKIKNIFKKNQIIIFALAIMICIAGYLSFANDNADEKKKEDAASATYNGDLLAEGEGDKLVDTDTEDADMQANDNNPEDLLVVNDPVSTDGDLLATDPGNDNPEATAQNDPTSETTTPGEAVLVTNTISNSYFSTAKLAREQERARKKQDLMNIIDNDALSDESKAEAIDAMIEMTGIAEKENATEILLEAKGFSGAVVLIEDGKVDVIVNSTSLTEQDKAIIEDVVTRKTGVSIDKLYITPVVTEE